MNGLGLLARDPDVLGQGEGGLPVEQRVVDHLRDAPLLVRRDRGERARRPRATCGRGRPRRAGRCRSASGPSRGARGRAARSGCSRRTAAGGPARPRRPRGSRRPSAVRIGMFWRFGSDDEMRPVAATVWLKVAWMRPVSGLTSCGQRVDVGGLELLHRAVLEDLARQLVEEGQLLEHLLGRGGGAGLGGLLPALAAPGGRRGSRGAGRAS